MHHAKPRSSVPATRNRCTCPQRNWQVNRTPLQCPHTRDPEKQCTSRKSWTHRPRSAQWGSSGGMMTVHWSRSRRRRIEPPPATRKLGAAVAVEDRGCDWAEGTDREETASTCSSCHGSRGYRLQFGFPARFRTPRSTRRFGPSAFLSGSAEGFNT